MDRSIYKMDKKYQGFFSEMTIDENGNKRPTYENEQLKAENSKLKETLNKAYDFMKQFVVDGRNLLERFLESSGQMVEKVLRR